MKHFQQGSVSDTVCTTVRVSNGIPEYWSLHLLRLQYFADVLSRKLNPVAVTEQVLQKCTLIQNGVLRVEMKRHGTFALSVRTLPEVRGLSFQHVISHRSIGTSRLKWLDRSAWKSIKHEHEVDILVLCDNENRYLECCIGNLFVYRPREDQWYAPSIDLPILPGIMRSVILSQLCREMVVEAHIVAEPDDELWMSNALRGLCPLFRTNPRRTLRVETAWSEQRDEQALKHFRAMISVISDD